MDVNGSRFALFLGDDWATCTDSAGNAFSLLWKGHVPGVDADLGWDHRRKELTLRQEVFTFPAGKRDVPPRLVDRRGAGADVFGNWYWIGPDARSILVESSGDGATTRFWPGVAAAVPQRLGTFGPVAPAPVASPERRLVGAAVTDDHFLVAGTLDPPGLLVFDLLTGGPPMELPWPGDASFTPFDIARRPGGGVFVLDVEHRAVWELDRNFHVVPVVQPAPEAAPGGSFAPVGGTAAPLQPEIGASEATPIEPDAIAVEALPDGGFLVLYANASAGESLVAQYADGVEVGIPAAVGDAVSDLEVVAFDMTLVGTTLFVADRGGNQSYAFTLALTDAGPTLTLQPLYYPMRLFGGKGIVAANHQAWYDFGDGWIPLAAQPRAQFVESGIAQTPVLDSGRPGCVWHRLTIDAVLPPDTALSVSTTAADDEAALGLGGWIPEPPPVLRASGSEVPFVDAGPYATYELLFQRAVGRYLQVRLELDGNGRGSPRVRAMRAWYPRFSYLERYLPGVYRQDPISSSFLDRYLANVEGLSTALEDQIAAVQVLFRPESTPVEWLDWLASWFDLALDPMWDEARRRLFLANAMQFFAARGTMRGVEIALRFVLDRCVDQSVYTSTHPPALATARIVESFRTRSTPGVVFGDPTDAEPLWVATSAARWQPAQGRDALNAGYAAFVSDPGAAYPLVDPGGNASAGWRAFSQAALGFVPEAADPARWRAFLSRRYPNAAAAAAAEQLAGPAPADFSDIDPPAALPADGAGLLDWFQFQSVVLPTERKAHRFSVLLPWPLHVTDGSGAELDHVQLSSLAQRVVDVQKPAHTTFDVKFFWAAFRIGEARLGDDTLLASGSRIPELIEPAVLGRDYVGTSTLAGPVASDELRRNVPPEPPAPQPNPCDPATEQAAEEEAT